MPILPVMIFLLFFAGDCDDKIYQQPCGAPCKYGDHLIYLQTTGIRDSTRLENILDNLGLQRRSDFMVEPRYLISGKLGIKWLGEYQKEMTLNEYNNRLNANIELFAPERNYFYREILYSKKPLTGERQTLYKLREALNMDLRGKKDAIGYVGDLCSAYESGCEKAYPSIIPIHKFGVEVNNPAKTQWNKDSLYAHFPFMKEYNLKFYREWEKGSAKFYTDKERGTVSFGIDLRNLSCVKIQNLAIRLGTDSDIRGLKGGSALEMATPVGCSKEEVKRRRKPDL
ncbi:MAG: hypothetical protein ABEH38_07410 [Flavobacteriales bacterium]